MTNTISERKVHNILITYWKNSFFQCLCKEDPPNGINHNSGRDDEFHRQGKKQEGGEIDIGPCFAFRVFKRILNFNYKKINKEVNGLRLVSRFGRTLVTHALGTSCACFVPSWAPFSHGVCANDKLFRFYKRRKLSSK